MSEKQSAFNRNESTAKEVSTVMFRKMIMRASPFFADDEEVGLSADRRGYALFLAQMIAIYLSDLFHAVRKYPDRVDYHWAWRNGARYYLGLLGINDDMFINRLLADYLEFRQRIDAIDSNPKTKGQRWW